MSLSTKPYKGARDFYLEDKRLQKYIFSKIRQACETYGYLEYDGPILEPTELFASKTSDEIVNEQTYSFVDRGGRNVTIRTEMTPTVSRMVAARRQELNYPLRWYSLPNIWRYERPQRGRAREFYQLNVDIFGVADLQAELEIIQLASFILKNLGATSAMYKIKINSRALMDAFLTDSLGLNDTQASSLIRLIDKKDKIDSATFSAQLESLFTPSERDKGGPAKLQSFLSADKISSLPDDILLHPSVVELTGLLNDLTELGITNIEFCPTLMRGFDYYTGIVFEVFDTNPENSRSMFGGGRYDGLVGQFGVEPVPTVGFGMGDLTLYNFLEANNLIPKLGSDLDLGVIVIGDQKKEAAKLIQELRDMGLSVAVDLTTRKIDKQIQSFHKQQLRYVAFVGDKEISERQIRVKDLITGKEQSRSPQRLVSIIKDDRQ